MTELSKKTQALLSEFKRIEGIVKPEESESVHISRAVSFFALVYEKIRNAIEFKDEHLIRRNAINRIVYRKLVFNPDLTDEANSIAKEISWAGYYKSDKIPESTIQKLEKTINWYMALKKVLMKGEAKDYATYFANFIREMLVCRIEEIFAGNELKLQRSFMFYYYQVLNPQVQIEGLDEKKKNLLFYALLDQVLVKSDKVYARYHLFRLLFDNLQNYEASAFVEHRSEYIKAFRFIDENLDKVPNRKIINYIKNQRPAFLILKELILTNKSKIEEILKDEEKLKAFTDDLCREKYSKSKKKLSKAGIRSIVYIFITKVIFVLIAEYPIMLQLGEGVDYVSLAINASFPLVVMALFVLFSDVPGSDNTTRIINRIKNVIYERNMVPVVFNQKKAKSKPGIFSFLFWVFYLFTFAATFWIINIGLNFLNFHFLSKIIFFFFLTAVCFFGFRVVQIAHEYTVKEKDNILTPIVDFFLIPLISVGKWLSSEISRLNFLIFIFDFLIEAPFKVLFEVIEEWIDFVRKRKEEIV